jgi:hypothetical protein
VDYAGFIGQAYTVQAISADCQRCVNLYLQQDETGGGKSPKILLSTPGLQRFADLTGVATGAVRGNYVTSKGRSFQVVGDIHGSFLVELSSTGAILGTYALPGETGTGQVSMTDNGLSMMILTGPNGYWFNFSALGNINSLVIDAPGTGWAVNDQFVISGGNGDAIGTITAATGGIPSAISIVSVGSGYSNATGAATTAQYPSAGVGLTVTLTVLAADTLTQITDEVFAGGTQCCFIDGYVIFNQPGTQKFWITNLYSTVINPLGFASAEGQPDILIGLLADHRELWLYSSTHAEVWYDSGNANFPFAFIQGAYISHGIAAPFSSARLDNTIFWLGADEFGNGIVWRADGYTPLRISTYAIEQAIQRYPTISDAIAWTYQQDGHSFYVLNFPSGNATWVYDAATGAWHERGYLGTLALNDGTLNQGRAINHSFAFGKHLVGDRETGLVYQMSPAFADDDAREVLRLRAAPYINNENKRITFHQFQLAMEVGQGNPGDPTLPEPVDPQISLRWTNDGGYTWSPYLQISMGVSGAYLQRVIWRRLGQSRTRAFEVSTGQRGITLSMYAAYLELEGSNS